MQEHRKRRLLGGLLRMSKGPSTAQPRVPGAGVP